MPRFVPYSYDQTKLIPIDFRAQIQPGTFEFTLNLIIDDDIDLSVFHDRYCNDDTGRPAYDPAILLKIVLFAYSRGITSSREIERACRENIIFMALSADTRPHFTTIADFISRCDDAIASVFRDVLLVCDDLQLIGRDMFAIDGCKLPSNASKEWSGTIKELTAKRDKLETAVKRMLAKHRETDAQPQSESQIQREQKQIKTLRKVIDKLQNFLNDHDDKLGATGKPVKSNITDNDSAKIKTSKGVIQGYCGVASVDSKQQIIIAASAHGKAQEQTLLLPAIEQIRDNLKHLGDTDPLKHSLITADAGYHSEANLQQLNEQHINALIADNRFRKRDPRFADADKYKVQHKKDRQAWKNKQQRKQGKEPVKRFTTADFIHDKDTHTCICPAGTTLYLKGRNANIDGRFAVCYQGAKRDCEPCHLRKQCLRNEHQKTTRQVCFFNGKTDQSEETATAKMIKKIDSEAGRHQYSQRLGTVEPVFGHIQQMGLRQFSLRTKEKVTRQWQLFCLVHNLKKVYHYAQ